MRTFIAVERDTRNDNSILEEYKVTDSEYPDYTECCMKSCAPIPLHCTMAQRYSPGSRGISQYSPGGHVTRSHMTSPFQNDHRNDLPSHKKKEGARVASQPHQETAYCKTRNSGIPSGIPEIKFIRIDG